MKEKQIIEKLFKEKETYEQSTKTKRTEMQTIWDAFNGKMTDKEYPWQSDKFIPKMRTEISYIMPFVFSGDPEVEIEGVGDEDKFIASLLEKMVNHRLSKDTFDKFSDWVIQALTFGTSLIKTTWKLEDDGEKIIKDEPILEVPNILDIFLNPLIPTIEKQVSVIERSTLTIADIKANSAYKNTDKVKPKGKFGDTGTYDSETLNSSDLDSTEKLQQDMEVVEVYERWTKDRLQTVADGAEKILLRDVKNPYGFIPYEKLIFESEPIPNRFYGKGVGQNTIDLQAMYYDMFNNVMDNIKILVNKMWKVRQGANVNPRDLVAKPGGTITVGSLDDVDPIEMTDIKQSAFELLGLIGDEHKRASGANDLIQGAETGDTLGQDNIRQNNATNRFELVRKRFKKALANVGNTIVKLEIKNMQNPDAEILRIFPKETREALFELISNEADKLKYDIKVKGDTTMAINKDIASKQLLDLYNLAGETLTEKERRAWIRAIAQMRGLMTAANTTIDELVSEEPQQQEEQQPIDGQQLPPINSQATQQGINQATYGI